MRIALFHNLPSGGGKRAVYELTRRMANQHTIDAYTLETADHEFCDIRPLVSQHRMYSFATRKLFKSPWGRLNQLQRWLDLGDLERVNYRIAMEINAGKYDVVFAHTCLFTFIPSLLQYIETPSIYYLHEPFGPGIVRKFDRPYLAESRLRKWLDHIDPMIWLYQSRLVSMQRRSILESTRLLANSLFTSNSMKAAFGVDAEFCPIGVDSDSFQPIANTAQGNFVISVGEMSPRKGFDFIIESLGKIPVEQRPALKLACNMVNENELRFIKDLARQKDVDLEVLTKVNTTQLRLLYNQAQLCVYTPILEPFGLVPLESMACGTPVVAVSEGGICESIVDGVTGQLIERDSTKFAHAILSLLENSNLRRQYGRQARQHVLQNWTWDRAVERLEQYLLQTVSGIQEKKLMPPYPFLIFLGFTMRRVLSVWYVNWVLDNIHHIRI